MAEEGATVDNNAEEELPDDAGSSAEGKQEWKELMGKDLMMKVEKATELGDAASSDHAEIHDAVVLDVVGHRIATSSDEEADEYELDESPFLKTYGLIIALGEGDVCNGIEMAARFLRVHERGIVRCRSKYAYGPAGRRRPGGRGEKDVEYYLPPNSDVVFRVTVRSVVSVESERFNSDEFRIERARAKKDLGNDVYEHEWDGPEGGLGKAKALKLYGKASEDMADLANEVRERNQDLRHRDESNEEVERKALAVLVDCLNNLSAVHLRAKSYGKAKEAAANVIKYDSNNMKALLRATRAAMLDPAGTYEESDAAIKAAEEIDKKNKEVKKLRAELNRKRKEYKKREKAMYGKMMGQAGKISKKEEKEGNGSQAYGQGLKQNPQSLSLAFAAVLVFTALCWSFYVINFMGTEVDQTDELEQGSTPAEESEF